MFGEACTDSAISCIKGQAKPWATMSSSELANLLGRYDVVLPTFCRISSTSPDYYDCPDHPGLSPLTDDRTSITKSSPTLLISHIHSLCNPNFVTQLQSYCFDYELHLNLTAPKETRVTREIRIELEYLTHVVLKPNNFQNSI